MSFKNFLVLVLLYIALLFLAYFWIQMLFRTNLLTPSPIYYQQNILFLKDDGSHFENRIDRYKRMDGEHGGQCVEFIQRELDTYYSNPTFRGIAGKIEPNAVEPKLLSAVITQESRLGHTALIIDTTDEDLILVESNLIKNDEIIRIGRHLKKDNKLIIGYFNFYNEERSEVKYN